MPKAATARLPLDDYRQPIADYKARSEYTTEETTYAIWLSESDVEALKEGIVTPYLQRSAVQMLAMRDGR